VAGGVFALIRARIREDEGAALVELTPSLMSFIALPYLGLASAGAALSGHEQAGEAAGHAPTRPVPGRLPIRVTHRTTLVLHAIAQAPCASNREIMRAAGPIDEGQLSKLLGRLAERGLIENVSRGAAGESNAWRLTGEGERALTLIGRGPLHAPRRVRGEA
jgi:hypothetical protein